MLKRLDILLKEKNFFESREKARRAIISGYVEINGAICNDVAKKFEDTISLEIKVSEGANKYVSRGAYKLEAAFDNFNIDVTNKIAVDIGSSTGGFCDVLLSRNVKKIYAIDVGKNQLHKKIKENPKVISMEETDFRTIENQLVEAADLVVTDVSFISIKPIAEKLAQIFKDKNILIIALLKPQFECGAQIARKYKGVIKNKEVHKDVIKKVINYWKNCGYFINKIIASPVKGGDGNIEYLTLVTNKQTYISDLEIENIVDNAFKK